MACPKPVRSLPLLFTHGPRPQTFLQAAAWPTKLFLWASEGNVRHPRARPSNAPRQPAGLPRPLLGGLSEACLSSFPKATLDTHGPRPQTLLGSRQACPGLSVAVRSLPLLFTHGPRPQTFLQAAAWPTKLLLWASEGNAASLWPVRSLPLLFTHGPRPQTFLQAAAWPTKLFLWASEGNVRHPRARPSNAPRQPAGLPRPLCGLSEACLFSSPTGPARKRFCRPQLGPQSFFYGLPKATLDTHGPRPQRLRGLSEACLFSSPTGPALKRSSAAGRPAPASLWPVRSLSEACLFSSPTGPARKRFCRPQLGPQSFFYGLPKATLDTHGPGPQTLLGSRQACPGLSVACPKPVRSFSSLHPRAPPSRQACLGLSVAVRSLPLLFTHGPRPQTYLQAAAWPTKLLLWASEGNAASLWPVRSLPLLFTHGPRPQTFLQAAAWPTKLFLWASEGNVRHPRARPSNAPRQPAGLPRPLCGLSEACLFSSHTGPQLACARPRSLGMARTATYDANRRGHPLLF